MKKLLLAVAVTCLMSIAAGTAAIAQTPAGDGPPPVLVIYREDVKPGMSAAHNKLETGWPKAFAKANTPNHYIALVSMSGPGDALFVEPRTSFAEIEKISKEMEKNTLLGAELQKLQHDDGALLSGARGMILTLNSELSRPGGTQVAHTRYVSVTTYRVRPGRNAEFTEFRQLLKSVNESNKTSNYFALYNVATGAPTGTFMLFRLLASLKELDPDPSRQTMAQMLGSDRQKKLNELVQSFMLSSENTLYEVKADMSYVDKGLMAADKFWEPKKAAVRTAVKKATPTPQKAAGSQ